MAVANRTIIKKMMEELREALNHEENQDVVLKRIANVKLLCELFVTENPTSSVVGDSNISSMEWEAMLGQKGSVPQEINKSAKGSTINHDDANGDSIFDF